MHSKTLSSLTHSLYLINSFIRKYAISRGVLIFAVCDWLRKVLELVLNEQQEAANFISRHQ